jgi:muramoyltetrapeptide carboxypeptidase
MKQPGTVGPSRIPFRKPAALRPGDTIGVIAPGSPVPAEALQRGVAELERLGYRVRMRPDILAADGFLAGSHQRRAEEFLGMLHDPEVRAIFCARGGYGANYVAASIREHPLPSPKIVMGYSDVTVLLAQLWQRERWVTFHGPMVSTDIAQIPAASWQAVLSGSARGELGRARRVLTPGAAEGILLGGCLSLLTASLGTPRAPDWRDALVFLEDVGEAPYRIDRLLIHLREAGALDGARGLIFGEMKDCGEGVEDVIARAVGDLGIPVIIGIPSGHVTGDNLCLPFGVPVRMEDERLILLEEAVE